MKKIVFIMAFFGVMSAGAWTCKASVVLQDSNGFYFELAIMCEYADQTVYNVNVYYGEDIRYVSSGLAFFGEAQSTLKITVFESPSIFSFTIESSLASGFPAVACWCNPNFASGNTWLTYLP